MAAERCGSCDMTLRMPRGASVRNLELGLDFGMAPVEVFVYRLFWLALPSWIDPMKCIMWYSSIQDVYYVESSIEYPCPITDFPFNILPSNALYQLDEPIVLSTAVPSQGSASKLLPRKGIL